MKSFRIMILTMITAVLLCGCGAAPEETEPATWPDQTECTEPSVPETTVPEPTEPEVKRVVFPEADRATGALKFYFGQQEVYAGGMVSDILALSVDTLENLDQLIQPGQISGNILVRVVTDGAAWEDWPVFYFNAINPDTEARKLAQCRIYGITVSMEDGIAFGSGREEVPFVTGQTTLEQVLTAYGDPDSTRGDAHKYLEMTYYAPFSTAFFSFQNGTLRQVMTCYSANLYGDLAAQFPYELRGSFGNDACILMNQYLDVAPYLNRTPETELVPISMTLEERIMLGTDEIRLGCRVYEMPKRFSRPFVEPKLTTFLQRDYYVRCGIGNPEEFYVINLGDLTNDLLSYAYVKGVLTQNRYYTNWDQDLTAFLEFEYMGLRSADRIEDVLAKFGQPCEMRFTSSPKACFVWLHYVDAAGSKLRICVDPMTDQIMELRISKYYPNETTS